MIHKREMYSAIDWLGAIGGVEVVLVLMFGFFLSGYCSF